MLKPKTVLSALPIASSQTFMRKERIELNLHGKEECLLDSGHRGKSEVLRDEMTSRDGASQEKHSQHVWIRLTVANSLREIGIVDLQRLTLYEVLGDGGLCHVRCHAESASMNLRLDRKLSSPNGGPVGLCRGA